MRHYLLFVFFMCLALQLAAQKSPTEQVQLIVEEGKELYRMEMASWKGTDIFIERYSDQSRIKGYFSYVDSLLTKCVFYSNDSIPRVIGTMVFDSTFEVSSADVDLVERPFQGNESDIYMMRANALKSMKNDTLFKMYDNTNFNLIPIIRGSEKKVYVLTGPSVSGVVIFGNDYLITLDEKNQVVDKKCLHKNIIPIEYGGSQGNGLVPSQTMHSHLPETGDFITATDVCTLMMYSEYAGWKSHSVVSKKYMSTWNAETNEVMVIDMKTIEAIRKHEKKAEKRQKRRDKRKAKKLKGTIHF